MEHGTDIKNNDKERTIMNNKDASTINRPYRHHAWMWLVLLVLFAMLAVSYGLSGRIVGALRDAGGPIQVQPPLTTKRPVVPVHDYSADIRRYNEAVAGALDRHLKRLEDIAGQFEAGLRERGPERFTPARAAIPEARRRFSSFGELFGIVKDGALDKALGGDRLQAHFNAALEEPFVKPCANAGESLVADYEVFVARMSAESAAFHEELAGAHGALPDEVRVAFNAEVLRDSMVRTYGALDAMPLKAGLVAAETAIEAATIRSTAAAAKRLALRYGKKAIGKGAVAAAAPAADGPSPILDIVAVGFAAWTACDIYELMDVLPREIEKCLTATVDALQSRTIEAVSEAAGKTLAAHEDAARQLAAAARAEQGAMKLKNN